MDCGKKNQLKKASFRQRLTYRFDNIMSKGTVSLVAILFLITALVVIVSGILVALLDGKNCSTVGGGIWSSLMHAIDAGTLTADSGSFLFMFLMTLVTVCGLFITSVLIGIINTGMEKKMESLRRGKSCVLEKGHTIILGVNRNTFILLNELILSNANHKSRAVVVMDENFGKEEMEDAIRQRIPNTQTTKIICRRGKISDMEDLRVCSPESAASIIVNCDDDLQTIKTILAVTTLLKQSCNETTYITAVIHNQENIQAANFAGEGRAEILFFEGTIARIVSHTSRQPGFSLLYTELFNFVNNEIYVESFPQLSGTRMEDLNLFFPASVVIGMERRGKVMLNPPRSTAVEMGDNLILIAQDDGVSVPSLNAASVEESAISPTAGNTPDVPQTILILGYSPRLGKILDADDQYMAPGSKILVAVQSEYRQAAEAAILPSYENIKVQFESGNIYCKQTLEELLGCAPDSVLVLSSLQEDAQEDDNRTLLLLLELRSISREKGLTHTVTSEMREVENQQLAQVTEVRDFVISSNITSLMVAQISQTRELNRIFMELLTPQGSEFYIRPAEDYVRLDTPVDFYTAGAAAMRKGQVLIGYRRYLSESKKYDVIVNPPKQKKFTFRTGDFFIVISES